ncbi:MAG: peptide-N-glycosidase, partial [Marinilabiliales bacterium]|nr:peptide-N-glycosidase [Marinilabiliales bacterium]
MKILLFFLLMGCGLLGFSQQSQHLTVMTHDHLTVTTNREGLNKFARWAQFPKKGLPIRKVLMHVTLGCPDSIPCAHWDYLDHITLLRSGGMQGKNCQLELGRLITPYGSQFKRGWHFTWTTDVTDFKQELRDSVLVEYAHSGWEPQNVGWSLTILFEIFAGRSVIETDSIHRLWQGSFLYGDSAKSIEERLGPMYFESKTSKSSFRLRIQQTGHGMDSPGNCSEFCPRWRKLLLDGKSFDQKNIWKECGDNPLYPQGGTWVYDRGGWCPGDLPPADCYDIIVGKGNHRLDLTMQPYKATGSPQAAENIAAYLMAYKGPFAKNDVALESILVPN